MTPIEATDADRYPGLSAAGRAMLERLREHASAPIFRNQSGHRLHPDDIDWVRQREHEVLADSFAWDAVRPPPWLAAFVAKCRAEVPRYAGYDAGGDFAALPTIDRGDLGTDIAAFVPDHVAVEQLITFQTSGTTGHPLSIPSQPRVAASYLAYHKRALRRFGITLRAGHGEVGVILLGFQQTCFTYASVTPTMDEAGLAKINLHPADWRTPADRARYLEAMAPEVVAGDPLSFAELLQVTTKLRPKALLSTAMTLLTGLREELEAAYACPVLDLYSLNEAGPVAVYDPALSGHVLLQPRLLIEILDPADRRLPTGERGEITLTGGFNFCLPLLRYRTGDFAALEWVQGEPILRGLEGRPGVRFRREDGSWFNNVDVTHVLRPLPLARFALRQRADGAFHFSVEGLAGVCSEAEAAVRALCGVGVRLERVAFPAATGKIVQYASELPGGTR